MEYIIALLFGVAVYVSVSKKVTRIEDTPEETVQVDETQNYSNKADELIKFKQLFDEGVISEQELDEAKKEILSQKNTQKNSTKKEIVCKKCGGTNFKRVRSTGGLLTAGVLAPKTRSQCQTCGFKNVII